MEPSQIDPTWPNALRYFLCQRLVSFIPWHFLKEADRFAYAADAFRREDPSEGDVFVFAGRQDCDDFAGLEIVNGRITDKVIYFHPGFDDSPSPHRYNTVLATYEDVFDFVAQQVIPDMKEWALTDDATDLDP